jgi:hypothetical protein
MANQPLLLNLTDNDRQRLPVSNDGKPMLFVANTWWAHSDKIVFQQLLATHFTQLKLISPAPNAPILAGQHLKTAADVMGKIAHHDTENAVFAMSIRFASANGSDFFYQKSLNNFFKTVRDAGFTVVLLHIQTDNEAATEYEKMFYRVRKNLTGKWIDKLTPQYIAPPTHLRVRVSAPIKPTDLQRFEKAHEVRRYLQSRLFAMSADMDDWSDFFRRWLPKPTEEDAIEPIAEATEPHLLATEIAFLRENHLVVEQGDFEVFVAESRPIPHLLHEIGRAREMTFRAVGEGTGRSLDLDEFDLYYRQLIIWDKTAARLVGGYRLGCGDDITENYGVHGFYTSTLFRIKEGFSPILSSAVELGRSYIVADYQRKHLPLFLLWKGILAFLIENPRYNYLFGPVSISRQFSDVSRGLIVAFLKKHYFNDKLAEHLRPRMPFKVKKTKVDLPFLIETFGGDITNLDKFIEGIEPSASRMPVLLRQYIRQNARFIGFNIDPNFSDALDGFIILDLKNLPAKTIENLQKERGVQGA